LQTVSFAQLVGQVCVGQIASRKLPQALARTPLQAALLADVEDVQAKLAHAQVVLCPLHELGVTQLELLAGHAEALVQHVPLAQHSP
jgi:hypothetical protein